MFPCFSGSSVVAKTLPVPRAGAPAQPEPSSSARVPTAGQDASPALGLPAAHLAPPHALQPSSSFHGPRSNFGALAVPGWLQPQLSRLLSPDTALAQAGDDFGSSLAQTRLQPAGSCGSDAHDRSSAALPPRLYGLTIITFMRCSCRVTSCTARAPCLHKTNPRRTELARRGWCNRAWKEPVSHPGGGRTPPTCR